MFCDFRCRSSLGGPERSTSVWEQCRGSGGWSGSAPFPVTQHRHRCDWTAGEGERGRKRDRERQERGETARGLGEDCRRRRYLSRALCCVGFVALFCPQRESFSDPKLSSVLTPLPSLDRSCVTGGREESRMNQWPFERSSSGCPVAETEPRDCVLASCDQRKKHRVVKSVELELVKGKCGQPVAKEEVGTPGSSRARVI